MNKKLQTGIVCSAVFETHQTAAGHPECPARLTHIRECLVNENLISACRKIDPQPAERKWLEKNHNPAYLKRLEDACSSELDYIDCADSSICPESFSVAQLAAGSVLKAADQIISGDIKNCFCIVRPPGHHAEHNRSMGFCLLNNIAIAAHYLLEYHGLKRVLILDWDVHHGNGTQHSFESDPRVFFCSFHGHPETLYPGTGFAEEIGKGAGAGYTLNIPLPPFSDDNHYRKEFFETFLPAARRFAPEIILISAGFDAHCDDPLGPMNLTEESFSRLTAETCKLANEHCSGRILSVLEGGYNLPALAECSLAHLKALMEA